MCPIYAAVTRVVQYSPSLFLVWMNKVGVSLEELRIASKDLLKKKGGERTNNNNIIWMGDFLRCKQTNRWSKFGRVERKTFITVAFIDDQFDHKSFRNKNHMAAAAAVLRLFILSHCWAKAALCKNNFKITSKSVRNKWGNLFIFLCENSPVWLEVRCLRRVVGPVQQWPLLWPFLSICRFPC